MSDSARYVLQLRSHVEWALAWTESTGEPLSVVDVWCFHQLRLQAAHVIGFAA